MTPGLSSYFKEFFYIDIKKSNFLFFPQYQNIALGFLLHLKFILNEVQIMAPVNFFQLITQLSHIPLLFIE